MVKFILQNLIFLSLAAILYFFVRTLPRIDDNELRHLPLKPGTHWFTAYLEKADEWLKFVLEKLLRRVRLLIMKLDNAISKKLNKFRSGANKETGFSTEKTGSDSDANNGSATNSS
ncbi:MAG: hypothetical protein AAB432_02700 [Patescibacteria group bacterium]